MTTLSRFPSWISLLLVILFMYLPSWGRVSFWISLPCVSLVEAFSLKHLPWELDSFCSSLFSVSLVGAFALKYLPSWELVSFWISPSVSLMVAFSLKLFLDFTAFVSCRTPHKKLQDTTQKIAGRYPKIARHPTHA